MIWHVSVQMTLVIFFLFIVPGLVAHYFDGSVFAYFASMAFIIWSVHYIDKLNKANPYEMYKSHKAQYSSYIATHEFLCKSGIRKS